MVISISKKFALLRGHSYKTDVRIKIEDLLGEVLEENILQGQSPGISKWDIEVIKTLFLHLSLLGK